MNTYRDIYVEPTDAMLPQDDGIDPEMQPDDLSLSPTDNVSIYTHVKSIY
jgi:hypothetical protein